MKKTLKTDHLTHLAPIKDSEKRNNPLYLANPKILAHSILKTLTGSKDKSIQQFEDLCTLAFKLLKEAGELTD